MSNREARRQHTEKIGKRVSTGSVWQRRAVDTKTISIDSGSSKQDPNQSPGR